MELSPNNGKDVPGYEKENGKWEKVDSANLQILENLHLWR
jgi:hypothetical protein